MLINVCIDLDKSVSISHVRKYLFKAIRSIFGCNVVSISCFVEVDDSE